MMDKSSNMYFMSFKVFLNRDFYNLGRKWIVQEQINSYIYDYIIKIVNSVCVMFLADNHVHLMFFFSRIIFASIQINLLQELDPPFAGPKGEIPMAIER